MQIELSRQFHINEYQSSDRDDMIANLRDGSVQKWTLLIPFPYTPADADSWLEYVTARKEADGLTMKWAIRNPDGRAIGSIGFHETAAPQSHAREIGYWITREYRRRGIMTEAVSAIVSHGFQHLGLSRITAAIFHGNHASAKVLEKAGFQLEAPLLQKCYLKNGRFLDAVLYAKVV